MTDPTVSTAPESPELKTPTQIDCESFGIPVEGPPLPPNRRTPTLPNLIPTLERSAFDGHFMRLIEKLDEIADRKAAMMAGRCKVPATRIRKWMDEVTTLDAKRALSYGLATEVPGLPKPKLPTVFL